MLPVFGGISGSISAMESMREEARSQESEARMKKQ